MEIQAPKHRHLKQHDPEFANLNPALIPAKPLPESQRPQISTTVVRGSFHQINEIAQRLKNGTNSRISQHTKQASRPKLSALRRKYISNANPTPTKFRFWDLSPDFHLGPRASAIASFSPAATAGFSASSCEVRWVNPASGRLTAPKQR